jgi:hypothetical protein
MPSGYTHKIGEGATFPEFAMDCARAFGACIMLRDEPGGGEKIPDSFDPSSYHAEALEKARADLDRVLAMSQDEIMHEAARDDSIRIGEHRRYAMERAELRAKYEAVLGEVRKWKPPTPDHDNLKSFMVQQITESIRFDCDLGATEEPKPVPPKQWHEEKVARLRKDIAYHAKEYEAEVQRAKDRTAWVRALRDSLRVGVTQ